MVGKRLGSRIGAGGLACVLVALVFTAGPSRAQPEAAATGDPVVERFATDTLARQTLRWLRMRPAPTAGHFQVVAEAMASIRRLAPDDAELLRWQASALSTAGDRSGLLAATREMLRLDPLNGPAQLRLVLEGLGHSQTVDRRLETYLRLLSDAGGRLDTAVRSQLALDAALLARDHGDDRRFLDLLTYATTLDPTNKDAAALYAATFMVETTDPFVRFDLMANIILADPLDYQAYDNLSAELIRHGAYEGAYRMLGLYATILGASGQALDIQHMFDFALCEWNTLGSTQALLRIARVLSDTIMRERAIRQSIIDDGRDPGPERPMLLPPSLQLFRLAIAVAERDEAGTLAIFEDYLVGNMMRLEQLDAIDTDSLEPGEVLNVRIEDRVVRLERLWAQLFADAQLDEAEAFIDELQRIRDASVAEEEEEEDRDATAPPIMTQAVIDRYRGWLLVHRGLDREAEAMLAPLVDSDNIARWAMAVLKEEQGLVDQAIAHYAVIAREHPRKAIGSTALARLNTLREEPVVRSHLALQLDEHARTFAPWLEKVVSDASSFMALRLRPQSIKPDPLDPIDIAVDLRNPLVWPLAVGTAAPIPKRLLLSPKVRIDRTDISASVAPIVLSFDDRLRLEPGETMTLTTSLRRQPIGRILDSTATKRVDMRFQAMQRFSMQDLQSPVTPGALTVTALTDTIARAGLERGAGAEQIADRLATAVGQDLLREMLRARRNILLAQSVEDDPRADQVVELLGAALIDRLGTMAPLERAVAVVHLSDLGLLNDPTLAAVVGETLTRDAASLASLAGLLTLPPEAARPVADHMVASGDPALVNPARAWLALPPAEPESPAP